MTDFRVLLEVLANGNVEFVIVGGLAATVHGSSRLTQDIDVVYGRSDSNLERLANSLASLAPYPRGAPPGLPFEWSVAKLSTGLNFTLTTTAGYIDLLGEISGGGDYEDLVAHTLEIELFAHPCLCLDLEWLIRTKRAAGRPRDFETVAELQVLREERDTSGSD
ncbi:MAG: hypothetical protein N2B05_02675 [Gemmatimonadales bacterium]